MVFNCFIASWPDFNDGFVFHKCVMSPNVAEPPPMCDVNRGSGTESANGGWLWKRVSPSLHF